MHIGLCRVIQSCPEIQIDAAVGTELGVLLG